MIINQLLVLQLFRNYYILLLLSFNISQGKPETVSNITINTVVGEIREGKQSREYSVFR